MNRLGLFNKIKALPFSKVFAFCVLGLYVALTPVQAAAEESKTKGTDWVSLPESDRSSFAGIHGGTTPVSVMGTETEPGLETVSGRTGDDFVQVLEGESDAAALSQAETNSKTAALVPFGLGETQTAEAGSSRLARADQEKHKARGAVRLNVEGLKVLNADETPVSPESLLQAEELERM